MLGSDEVGYKCLYAWRDYPDRQRRRTCVAVRANCFKPECRGATGRLLQSICLQRYGRLAQLPAQDVVCFLSLALSHWLILLDIARTMTRSECLLRSRVLKQAMSDRQVATALSGSHKAHCIASDRAYLCNSHSMLHAAGAPFVASRQALLGRSFRWAIHFTQPQFLRLLSYQLPAE